MNKGPKDLKLYEKIKKQIYAKNPIHSAYRSGLVVSTYKKVYLKKYNSNDSYYGVKEKKKGLSRWYSEKWRNDKGGIGYTSKSSVYRPTKRITKDTPVTFNELTKKELKKAKREKAKKGRVKKFKK
jgi:hypothetical protein